MVLVSQFAKSAGLNESEAYACRLAIDEACVNIIEHAYFSNQSGEIEVWLKAGPGVCEICLTDFGQPYNPQEMIPATRAIGLEHARPGGLGLHLINTMMDVVVYRPSPHGNSLLMVKRRTGA